MTNPSASSGTKVLTKKYFDDGRPPESIFVDSSRPEIIDYDTSYLDAIDGSVADYDYPAPQLPAVRQNTPLVLPSRQSGGSLGAAELAGVARGSTVPALQNAIFAPANVETRMMADRTSSVDRADGSSIVARNAIYLITVLVVGILLIVFWGDYRIILPIAALFVAVGALGLGAIMGTYAMAERSSPAAVERRLAKVEEKRIDVAGDVAITQIEADRDVRLAALNLAAKLWEGRRDE